MMGRWLKLEDTPCERGGCTDHVAYEIMNPSYDILGFVVEEPTHLVCKTHYREAIDTANNGVSP